MGSSAPPFYVDAGSENSDYRAHAENSLPPKLPPESWARVIFKATTQAAVKAVEEQNDVLLKYIC